MQWLQERHEVELKKINLLGEGHKMPEETFQKELTILNRRIERYTKLLNLLKVFD